MNLKCGEGEPGLRGGRPKGNITTFSNSMMRNTQMNSDTERGSALLTAGQVGEDIEVKNGRSRAQVFIGYLPVSRYCPVHRNV